ncbi:MAG TPA: amino acid ABC transporter permease [Candidatus Sulfotelmatobacter sp.]|nr:amino acid ABC transporter permease [Candidatus Sulfotelmatobacter sp.]
MSTADLPASPISAAPVMRVGVLRWLRENLFNSWYNALLTLVAVYVLYSVIARFVSWGVIHAVWSGPATACQAAGAGACWAVIGEKYRFILFGRYDYEEQWRPCLMVLLFIGLVGVSSFRQLWGRVLGAAWAVGLIVMAVLMFGGVLGLPYVTTENWGGLPLTLILSVTACVCAFPVGVVLALGRRSHLPAIRSVCVAYIEFVRGVPLVTVLFMASIMFPLLLPPGMNFNKLLRVEIGLILFAAAYLAEIVRGGLQAVAKGQYEAADSLGLSYVQKTTLIVLPQALRIVIPALVNTFIGTFKDTTLVIIVGLFDLLSAAKTALQDPPWRGAYWEVYLFIALIYFGFCFFISKYSQNLEARLRRGVHR